MLPRYHFSELASTNDTAKEFLHNATIDAPFAVTASLQTRGRGRNGKSWLGAAHENVYCSIGIRHTTTFSHTTAHNHDTTDLIVYQARGTLAALRTIRDCYAENMSSSPWDAILKYPNDVYGVQRTAHGMTIRRKLSGVLVEHEFIGSDCISSVIGIGINVRQTIFHDDVVAKASSMLAFGVDVAVESVVERLIVYSESYLEASTDAVFNEWRHELGIEGATVRIVGEGAVNAAGEWYIIALQYDGRLLAQHTTTGELRTIDNGDSIVRTDW
jgi:biotin-(acetyl-CoA carboxylase) ligase